MAIGGEPSESLKKDCVCGEDDYEGYNDGGGRTYRGAVSALRRLPAQMLQVELVADHAQLSPELSLDREDGWRRVGAVAASIETVGRLLRCAQMRKRTRHVWSGGAHARCCF